MQYPPIVLSFSALDPSGCGGLQADIETAASLGCHCAPIATALCSAGSAAATEVLAVDATLVIEQSRSVLEDMSVKAIKVGFAGSVANVEAIHSILQDYPHIPLIMHPAFCLWDEDNTDQADLPTALSELLLPLATILVASIEEAHILVTASDTVDATAQGIANTGCRYLLLNEQSPKDQKFQATLYDAKGPIQNYLWEQATPTCHGSASTLTSAIAAFQAHGSSVQTAVEQAQNFAWQALVAARQLGFGKPTPHRLFWADKNIAPSAAMPSGNRSH
jgi:hydroxymethylpyrimidine/phosphomethylpyrimidine kinase